MLNILANFLDFLFTASKFQLENGNGHNMPLNIEIFPKMLILAFEANSELSCQNGPFPV